MLLIAILLCTNVDISVFAAEIAEVVKTETSGDEGLEIFSTEGKF